MRPVLQEMETFKESLATNVATRATLLYWSGVVTAVASLPGLAWALNEFFTCSGQGCLSIIAAFPILIISGFALCSGVLEILGSGATLPLSSKNTCMLQTAGVLRILYAILLLCVGIYQLNRSLNPCPGCVSPWISTLVFLGAAAIVLWIACGLTFSLKDKYSAGKEEGLMMP